MRKNPSSSSLEEVLSLVIATCTASASGAGSGKERIKFAGLNDLWSANDGEQRMALLNEPPTALL